MSLTLVIAPAEAPISLTRALGHLRVKSGEENDLVADLIVAVTTYVDGASGILGRALVTQTWDLKLDRFPVSSLIPIEVQLPPLQSVSSIKYIDTDGVEQEWDNSEYQVASGENSPLARILPAFNESWPITRNQPDAVTIRYVAGYGTPADVPGAIKSAMLLIIGELYERREEAIAGTIISRIPFGAEALLRSFRVRTKY